MGIMVLCGCSAQPKEVPPNPQRNTWNEQEEITGETTEEENAARLKKKKEPVEEVESPFNAYLPGTIGLSAGKRR